MFAENWVANAGFFKQVPNCVIGAMIMLFFAILFLQSGIDKLRDQKGNREWLIGQFSKSILNGFVPFLLVVLTLMEVVAGLAALVAGVLIVFVNIDGGLIPFCVSAFCAGTLLALFFGQRVAKDYAGAAGIVPYFIVAMIAMVFFGLGI